MLYFGFFIDMCRKLSRAILIFLITVGFALKDTCFEWLLAVYAHFLL